MLQVQINFDWSGQNCSISMNPGLRPEPIQNSSERTLLRRAGKVCVLSMGSQMHLKILPGSLWCSSIILVRDSLHLNKNHGDNWFHWRISFLLVCVVFWHLSLNCSGVIPGSGYIGSPEIKLLKANSGIPWTQFQFTNVCPQFDRESAKTGAQGESGLLKQPEKEAMTKGESAKSFPGTR